MRLRERKAARWLLDLFFPTRCAFCGRIMEWDGEEICASCQQSLPWTEGTNAPVEFCDICLSPLHYREGVRRALLNYKFRKGMHCSTLFGTLMSQCLADRGEGGDVVVWVPLSKKSLRKRGYDQSELLARRVGQMMGLPVVGALEKVRRTAVQSRQKGAAARRANVLGAYRVRPEAELSGLRVILVDDVVTSGATLSECAACLRMAGAKEVTALTFATAGH